MLNEKIVPYFKKSQDCFYFLPICIKVVRFIELVYSCFVTFKNPELGHIDIAYPLISLQFLLLFPNRYTFSCFIK